MVRRYEGFPEGWPIERLVSLHGFVSQLLADGDDRIRPDWPVLLCELARIIKAERRHAQYVDEHTLWLQSPNK